LQGTAAMVGFGSERRNDVVAHERDEDFDEVLHNLRVEIPEWM
jgi:hypothetical protein